MLIDVFRKLGRLSDMRLAEARWGAGIEKMRMLEASPDVEQPFVFMHAKKNYK